MGTPNGIRNLRSKNSRRVLSGFGNVGGGSHGVNRLTMGTRKEIFTIKLCSGARLTARKRLRPQAVVLLAAFLFLVFQTHFIREKLRRGTPTSGGDASTTTRRLRQSGRRNPPPQTPEPVEKILDLPPEIYPTIQYPLENADVVAIFFGVSWGGETRLLRDAFARDQRLLVSPEGLGFKRAPRGQQGMVVEHRSESVPLAIVYVPADDVEGSSEWIHVEEQQEMINLMVKFRVGFSEADKVKRPDVLLTIPALIVLDGATHGVITAEGLEDVASSGNAALLHWLDKRSDDLTAISEPFQKEATSAR